MPFRTGNPPVWERRFRPVRLRPYIRCPLFGGVLPCNQATLCVLKLHLGLSTFNHYEEKLRQTVGDPGSEFHPESKGQRRQRSDCPEVRVKRVFGCFPDYPEVICICEDFSIFEEGILWGNGIRNP